MAPSVELGISSSASDPDGCWTFIRRFLLPDYQMKLDSSLPISRKAIKKQGDDVIQSFKEQQLSAEEYLREQDALVSEDASLDDSMDDSDDCNSTGLQTVIRNRYRCS